MRPDLEIDFASQSFQHVFRLFLIFLFVAAAFSALAMSVRAQPGPSRDEVVLDSMSNHASTIKLKVRNTDSSTTNLCNDIQALVARLKVTHQQIHAGDSDDIIYQTTSVNGETITTEVGERRVTTLSAGYISSLQLDDQLLAELLKSGVVREMRRQTLADVKEDLEAKNTFLTAGSFIEDKTVSITGTDPAQNVTTLIRRAGDVLVTAETLHDTQTIKGYAIYYVPQGWAKVSSHFVSFSSLSTTKGDYLSPGPYFVWAVKGSTKTEPRLTRIGSQGPNQLVQIAVPNN